MKKKILSLLLVVCFIIPCMFLLVGCGGVQMDTKYVVKSVEFNWASEEEKTAILAGKTEAEMLAYYNENETYIMFKGDGTMVAVSYKKGTSQEDGKTQTFYYKQGDGNVYVYADEAKEGEPSFTLVVKGNQIHQESPIGTPDQSSTTVTVYEKQ